MIVADRYNNAKQEEFVIYVGGKQDGEYINDRGRCGRNTCG